MKSIIVHGGAGTISEDSIENAKQGVRLAAQAGYNVLLKSNSAVDACCAAVNALEDNPIFNAGTGSVLTLDGKCEMDAAIMKGSTLEAGAIAGIENVKNPISIARKVMEETDHVLLIGEGASKFASVMGFPVYNPVTEHRKKQWAELKERLLEGKDPHWKRIKDLIKKHPELLRGTVGCVAMDDSGEIVAGTSTGGVFLKLFGRVGDTPLLGAGTYATSSGGASATGIGEGIMRTVLSKTVCNFMRMDISAQSASAAGIDMVTNVIGSWAGIIAIDRRGNIGFAKNTKSMPVAYMKESMQKIEVSI